MTTNPLPEIDQLRDHVVQQVAHATARAEMQIAQDVAFIEAAATDPEPREYLLALDLDALQRQLKFLSRFPVEPEALGLIGFLRVLAEQAFIRYGQSIDAPEQALLNFVRQTEIPAARLDEGLQLAAQAHVDTIRTTEGIESRLAAMIKLWGVDRVREFLQHVPTPAPATPTESPPVPETPHA